MLMQEVIVGLTIPILFSTKQPGPEASIVQLRNSAPGEGGGIGRNSTGPIDRKDIVDTLKSMIVSRSSSSPLYSGEIAFEDCGSLTSLLLVTKNHKFSASFYNRSMHWLRVEHISGVKDLFTVFVYYSTSFF